MPARPSPPALFVTQHYAPEVLGSAPYCTDIAEALAARGREVVAFTCRPHYPQGVVPPTLACIRVTPAITLRAIEAGP